MRVQRANINGPLERTPYVFNETVTQRFSLTLRAILSKRNIRAAARKHDRFQTRVNSFVRSGQKT